MSAQWLVPAAAFWTITAMYLGGAAIEIEGGGAWRQLGGLVVGLVIYFALWIGIRAGLATLMGSILALVFSSLAVVLLLPLVHRIAFRVLGVKIRAASASHGHGAASA
ncbi:MAG TPA: hypothetical protein VKA48_04330 [Gammaproteobacteria bacterium]|nr:hypothetical protein [Gammaproteobacteria bacterium]